jgi:hypothetical protein
LLFFLFVLLPFLALLGFQRIDSACCVRHEKIPKKRLGAGRLRCLVGRTQQIEDVLLAEYASSRCG